MGHSMISGGEGVLVWYKYFYHCIVFIVLLTSACGEHTTWMARCFATCGSGEWQGKSEQRAFFISTQLCFDFTLDFACTQSSQNSAQGTRPQRAIPLYRVYRFEPTTGHVNDRLPWPNASSPSLTSCNVEPARLSHGVKSMANIT